MTPDAVLHTLATSPRWPILFVHHGWGGGIARHIQDLERLLRERCEILHLTPAQPGTLDGRVRLSWQRDDARIDGVFSLPQEWPQLIDALKALGVVRVHLHHVHALPQEILALPQALDVPFDVTLHDHFALGDQYHLADHRGRFSGEPLPDEDDVLAIHISQWSLTTAEWRGRFRDFLQRAARVIAPSHDIAERIHRLLPVFTPLIWPHPQALRLTAPRLRVAVLGTLSREKGFDTVMACAHDAEARDLPLAFRILGNTAQPLPELPLSRLSTSGEYDDADLPAFLAAEKPDVFFFPAQVPESFCYALTPALLSGRPVVASQLGALPERLHGLAQAITLPWNSAPSTWNDALCRHLVSDVEEPAACDNEDDYRQRYLAPLPSVPRAVRDTPAIVWPENTQTDPETTDHSVLSLLELYEAGVGCGQKAARKELLHRLKVLQMTQLPPLPPPLSSWRLVGLETENMLRKKFLRFTRMTRTALTIYKTAGARAVFARSHEKLLMRRRSLKTQQQPPMTQETVITPLTLATSATPRVSILIAAFGEPLATFSCIKSVHDHTHGIAYEVLVLDDASPTQLHDQLASIQGVRFLRQETNLGFLKNCNAGAREARGEILVFLNNDTLVTEGWLTALVETLDRTPGAGLVGAQLIYPDHRLQEAGGIVFRDGSAWNYGRTDDPARPEFHYRRDVDYCSGACIALPKVLFERLEGFDERYAPAYYEDTDLAFQVRALGLRVLYQPLARVFHFEGQTSGTDETQGVKRYQVINRSAFFDKWHAVLAHHPERSHDNPRHVDEHAIHTRILVIDACMLTPDRDSGSLRMWQMLQLLAQPGRRVTFAASSLEYRTPYVEQLQALGIEVIYYPYVNTIESFLQARGSEFDLIVLSRLEVAAQWLGAVRQYAPQAFAIFDTVDLHFLRAEREADVLKSAVSRAQATAQKKQELQLIRAVDRTWVVSPTEQTLLAPLLPEAPIAVLSNIHEPKPAGSDFTHRAGILFIGSFRHPPNVDAMLWYGSEVLPHVRQLLPGVVTTIIGGDLPSSVKALVADDVVVTGYVENVEPFFMQARVSIAPLRYGAGVKGKVNQAMSYGVPVIATPMAAEGMYLTDGQDVLIAEGARAFAEAIARAYQQEALWHKLATAGRANIESHFSRDIARQELDTTLALAKQNSRFR